MRRSLLVSSILVLMTIAIAQPAQASQLVDSKLDSKLVPAPVEFSVLLPDGYESIKEPVPLLLFLHGLGGDRTLLTRMRPIIDDMWNAGTLPKMVIATPSAGRSGYMDYRDGSQKWESFIIGPFLEHLRQTYRVSRERKGTLLFGISMGGLGGLRLAFKYPNKFQAVAALEPAIDPALKLKEVPPRNRFYRNDELMQSIFGKPLDEAYWEANNPASIVVANADKIRGSKLEIYIDVGDLDAFNINDGTEFVHRILWESKIAHEYHLVRGADHVGRTIKPRTTEALGFLNRVLKPPPPDPEADALHERLEPMKRAAEKRP
jgi:S-formylglutathione hydrolase